MTRIICIVIAGALAACGGETIRELTCPGSTECPQNDAGPIDAGPPPMPDAGPSPADAGPPAADAGDPGLMNVDPVCADGDGGVDYPPPNMLPLTVPDDCLSGFEMNDFHSTYSIGSLTSAGSREISLEVDIATYDAPDVIRIEGTVNNVTSDVLLTCDLRTSTYGDPTHGMSRPPQDSIREFRVPLAAGTTELTFDFTGAHTPTYIRVLGLCDFALQPPQGMARKWRVVMSR